MTSLTAGINRILSRAGLHVSRDSSFQGLRSAFERSEADRVILRAELDRLQRVRKVWGSENSWRTNEIRHWLQIPAVHRRINYKITGYTVDRFQYFLDRYLAGRLPVERALTLGCGGGDLERGMAQYKFARRHEAIDLFQDAIRAADAAAQNAGLHHISYFVGELNSLKIERGVYDVIFGVSSIHHVARLEHVFEQVRAALKPGGFFFLDEYIGPSRFQWTDTQLRLMNEQLLNLPPAFRRSVSVEGQLKDKVIRKTVECMIAEDPSEAVRSAEIVPLLSRYFNVVEFKGYGGSLLFELLADIAGNFAGDDPEVAAHLNHLFKSEDDWIENGTLAHDFAVIIATV